MATASPAIPPDAPVDLPADPLVDPLVDPLIDPLAGAPFAAGPDRGGGPRSVARVLQLLDRLAAAPEGLSLAALAQALAAPKTTLLGLLRGLAAAGYASQAGGVWRLGPECFGLAHAILATRPEAGLGAAGHALLERLAETTGESAMLAVLAPDRSAMVYIDKVESRTALRFAATVGDRRPIHCTASGRVMLAWSPPPWPDEYLGRVRLEPLTGRSVTDRRSLRRLVAEVRELGHAVTLGEATEGVAGIAAPVFDARGAVVAGIVLAAPLARAQPRLSGLARQVRQAGRALSRRLGWRPGRADNKREE
ncbi:IclR family transcriptional regulator [Roseomonas sp. NAR14]|uniref:IclR family transcriptional regulator n=1 Tax=Roseomonas acroporae TaxID=2937791 RepID=A0A9X1YA20_9PROT|nr:IclR family transcriptional regulator [Roseomonas acroporae]MCK8785932.1 IclR family transcriptional regulator [Roseomonas acroporae]